ncbi:MAG: hypothetical protein R6V57_10860 [Vicinamibacterales bacterium]
MAVETAIRTGRPAFDGLFPLVRGFLERSVLDLAIDGQRIRGYRTPDARSVWIRDHSDMMRTFRHFEPDLCSAVQHFADTQAANGRVFDYVTTHPEKPPGERENWTKYVRVPVEADVEYRFVKAAYLAWQASGDDEWMTKLLPSLERAMRYITTHPWYWDSARGLVKRPYTIDTWDFAYTAGRHGWLQFQITDDTYWGYMHGDLSGYYEAFGLMAALHARFGDERIARYWERRAADLCAAMNAACWNGRFYTHFVKMTPVAIAGVDEAAQLSLSNPMAINRGAADHGQAVSILREYQRRGAEGRAFAEWFSIDPPFPDGIFGDERLVRGAYVNGGIMPLVGGELARAAFEHGFEAYGADILTRYYALVAEEGEAYLWYFPDGRPSSVETSTSPEAQPTDGWGSSAMAWALVEGLAGVVDRGRTFDSVRVSPRWEAAGIDSADVSVGYAASGASVRYKYRRLGDRITLEIDAAGAEVRWHVLLPAGHRAVRARCGGREAAVDNAQVESSAYADGSCRVDGLATVEIDITAA